MTATRSQGKPASSSFSDTVAARGRIVTALSDAFQAVRNLVVTPPVPYRDCLGPKERGLYDAFHEHQENAAVFPILLVVSTACGEIGVESLCSVREANIRAAELIAKKTGHYALTAFDLTQSFEEQWKEKPTNDDHWIELFRRNPKSVASGIILASRYPDTHLSRKPD